MSYRAKVVDPNRVKLAFEASEEFFSLSRLVKAALQNGEGCDGEQEICQRLAAKERPRYGQFIPYSALRTLTTGSGAAGGYLVGTETKGLIDYLRPFSVAAALGVQTIGGLKQDLRIPRFTQGATADWAAEGETPAESTPTTGLVSLSPKRLAAFVDYSRELLLQSEDLESVLRRDLAAALASALDAGLLAGSGTSSQPTGILNTAGIGSVNGASFTLATAASIVKAVEDGNVPLSGPGVGWVASTDVAQLLRARASNGTGSQPLINENKLLGFPVYVTTSLPAGTILFGNFAGGVQVAQWGPGIDLLVNPYTGSKNRLISIVANAWCDICCRWPQAFCKAEGVN